MPFSVNLMRKLDVLEQPMKEILWVILDEVEQPRETSVTKTEFNELKNIVKELGQSTKKLVETQNRAEQRLETLEKVQDSTNQHLKALTESQQRTEQRLGTLTKIQERLIQSQKDSNQAIEKLTESQNSTENKITKLSESLDRLAANQERSDLKMVKLSESLDRFAEAQERTEQEVAELSRSLKSTRNQLGGLSRSFAYALENEAFRKLPAYLKMHHQVEIKEHFIRTLIGGEEINLFAKALQEGQAILVVGETVSRLDDRAKLGQLEKNLQVVKEQFEQPVLPIIITHFAHPLILEKAREQGVLVVHSFEWE